ncbi:MAG: hypothetical protein ABJJ07_00580, partial [Maribacter dokdonensis]
MRKIAYLILGALCLQACSETPKEETQSDLFARIDTEIKQNSKGYSTLKEATETIGHRLTGSTNGAQAEEYTYNKFKEYGFEDVVYQTFEVEAWARGEVALTINEDDIKVVTLGHAPVEAHVTGEIVDMGNGLDADYA